MIGKEISPILIEIEQVIENFELHTNQEVLPEYTDEAFRAITKIFFSALLEKMFLLLKKENLIDEGEGMAYRAGKELRSLIKTYADVDTHKMYN